MFTWFMSDYLNTEFIQEKRRQTEHVLLLMFGPFSVCNRAVFVLLASDTMTLHDPPTWQPQSLAPEECTERSPTLTSTPVRLSDDPNLGHGRWTITVQ